MITISQHSGVQQITVVRDGRSTCILSHDGSRQGRIMTRTMKGTVYIDFKDDDSFTIELDSKVLFDSNQ